MGQALKVIKFDSDEQLEDNKKSKKNSGSKLEYFLIPLRTAAIITAILGIASLVLEVRMYFQFRYEIYLARLFPTLFSLTTLILLQSRFGKKNHVLLTHLYLFITLASLSFVGFKIPSLYTYNLTAASIFILTLSLYLYWGKNNQIIAASYFLLLFGSSAIVSNLLSIGNESTILVLSSSLLLLIISVFANSVRTGKNKNASKNSIGYSGDRNSSQSDEIDKSYISNSIVPLFQIDLNGNFDFGNQSFSELLSLINEKDLNELNFFDDIINNEKVQKHILKKIESKGKVENFRFTYIKKDGSEEILLLDCKTKNIDNEVYLEGSLRNITLQFEKDKAIRREIEVLKQSNRQRSKIIPSFSDTDSKQSNVVSKMGHALRTPMNSVLGFLTLIENGLFENEQELKEFSHSAKLSAESLLGLINDVVEIAKIQEGIVEIDEKEFNLKEEIERITAELIPHLKPNDLNIILELNQNVPEVVIADKLKYSQILINLLRNAIQVTESGNIKLSISAKNNGNKLKLKTSVTDLGKGTTESELNKLLDDSLNSKDSISASVLHLLISRELIYLLEGSISATSEIGNGTEISFEIIVDSNLAIDNKQKNTQEIDLRSESNISARPKLLLVEDNPISRKVEQKLLQESGYDVDCVDNGTAAIEKVKNGNYNLVLMDIELKDMNGLEATKLIRELPDKLRDIPIIAVTAHSSMKDREKCLIAGMNDYISKPINITFLKMTIDQWLNEARAKS